MVNLNQRCMFSCDLENCIKRNNAPVRLISTNRQPGLHVMQRTGRSLVSVSSVNFGYCYATMLLAAVADYPYSPAEFLEGIFSTKTTDLTP